MPSISMKPYTVNGLRPHADIPKNAPYMELYTNLMCSERGAKRLPEPTWPDGFPSMGSSWPMAQTFVDERVALAVVDNTFYTLNRSALTSSPISVYEATRPGNIIANGAFADATKWTESSDDISISAGVATFSNATNDTLKQTQVDMAIFWTTNKVHEVTFTVTVSAGSLNIGTNTIADQANVDSSGTYTVEITSDFHADGLVFTGVGFTGTLDNVSAVQRYTMIGSTGLWDVAAFRDSWFATSGNQLIYKAPSTEGNRVAGHNVGFTCNAVSNWNDRLVLGGCSGSRFSHASFTSFYNLWLSRDKRNVVTSEDDTFNTSWLILGPPVGGDSGIPNGALLALLGLPSDTVYTSVYEPRVRSWAENGTVDLFPCRYTGAILRTKVFNGDLIVYGTEGISRIRQTEIGPVEERLSPIGLWARGAVGGNESEHLCVCSDNNMYMAGGGAMRYAREGVYAPEQIGSDFYRLGFAEFADKLNSGVPTGYATITHDPQEQRYWWAFSNDGYLLTKTGLCRSLGVLPSAILRLPGSASLLGAAKTDATGFLAVTLQTLPFDAGRRDTFIIPEVDLTVVDTDSNAANRWKVVPYAKLQKHESMITHASWAELADIRGRASIELLALEAAIRLTAVDRTKVDIDDGLIFVAEPGKTPSMRKWLTALGA